MYTSSPFTKSGRGLKKAALVSVLATTLVFTFSVFSLHAQEANGKSSAPTLPRPLVSVVERSAGSQQVTLSLFGVASAHYRQQLTSEVNGRIVSLSEKLEPGQFLAMGELIAVIEDSSYQAALANAQQSVAEAELSLLQEQQRGKQAELDWKRAKLDSSTPSPLVLRKPFLKLEELKLVAAQAQLKEAERNLSNTRITAPFDAIVISRSTTPSAYITTGTQITEIYSTDELESQLNLSPEQWRLLLTEHDRSVSLDRISASVVDDTGEEWTATISGFGAIADDTTRQQSIRLKIEPRSTAGTIMRPGSFIQAILKGPEVDNAILAPSSAVTLKGYVWTIDENNLLHRHKVSPLFAVGDQIALNAEALPEAGLLKIVVNPISRYLPGQLVEPQVAE